MTTPLAEMKQAVNNLQPLVSAVRQATSQDPAFSYTGIGVSIVAPAIAGTVLLLSARFEEYLKTVVEAALGQYSKAAPPIGRSSLQQTLQLKIIKENLTSASREMVHGKKRDAAARLNALMVVANRIVNDEIWGDDAIDTHGNPGRETVSQLLSMIGIANPWNGIEALFALRWNARRQSDATLKQVPRAADELDSLLVWRNAFAHSSTSAAIGERELLDAIAFIEVLAESIDTLICNEIDTAIIHAGCTPGVWP